MNNSKYKNQKSIDSNSISKQGNYQGFSRGTGWHWIDDASGSKPVLWRGSDWPNKADRNSWEDFYDETLNKNTNDVRNYGLSVIPKTSETIFALNILLILIKQDAAVSSKTPMSRKVSDVFIRGIIFKLDLLAFSCRTRWVKWWSGQEGRDGLGGWFKG